MVDKAKSPLWATGQSISEIAYDLVFEHPFHFTKQIVECIQEPELAAGVKCYILGGKY